jgi:pimeloyl-ACP methyl ester carboxylesterase
MPVPPVEHTVTVNGLRLHYLAWGEPAPRRLLLLHGSQGHAWLWQDVAAQLAHGRQVLALDLRGHGDSARPDPPSYRLRDYADDVRALAAAQHLEPLVLIGHSLGALVAMLLAGTGALALAGAAFLDIEAAPPSYQAEHLNAAGARPAPRFATLVEAVEREARSLVVTVPRERLTRLVALGLRPLPEGGFAPKADREALRQFEQVDLRPLLPRVACPALVMRGAESRVMRREAELAMASSLPLGRFVEVAGAGHQLILEQPAATAHALAAWLDEIGA